ncbi:MAG: hypothetical protein OEV66_10600 [Spirochaetia bacterium]|nr:hypothetical protein [Spirochaetia bacterium]
MTVNSIKTPEILLVTNKGGAYGMGHFYRMNLLSEHLKKMKIASDIALGSELKSISGNYKLIILDSRDDNFPEILMNQKSKYNYYVALDNRGEGRKQCDIVWDTLPHFEMNLTELKNVLKNCILDPEIFQIKGRPDKAKIIKTTAEEVESGKLEIDLIQKPLSSRDPLAPNEFHKRLIESHKVATYYGQTFFEALYLGKEIYLFDISEYHKRLSDWFIPNWEAQPEIVHFFDGQGLHRLAVLARSIVSGVLDFPMM